MTHTEQPVPTQSGDRGNPDSPLELHASDWKESLRRAVKEFKEDRGGLVAAGMAFYWFLAVIPSLLAAVGIMGLINATEETVSSITRAIQSALPGDAARTLTETLNQATSRSKGSSLVAAVIGIALALWSGSAGMVAVQTGLDVVYDVPEERTFVKKRARALLLLLVAGVLGGVATAAIVFGQPIGEGLRDNLPFGGAFILVWTLLRWTVGLAALTMLFATFYYLGPNRDTPRWAWLSPGGLLATLIWLLASLGFSFYVSSLGSYGRTYGSLTGVVVLMLWLYLAGIAIVLGGEVNAELERQGEKRRRKERRKKGPRSGDQPAGRQPAHAAAAHAGAPAARMPDQAGEPEPAATPNGDGYTEWLERMRRVREGQGPSS